MALNIIDNGFKMQRRAAKKNAGGNRTTKGMAFREIRALGRVLSEAPPGRPLQPKIVEALQSLDRAPPIGAKTRKRKRAQAGP